MRSLATRIALCLAVIALGRPAAGVSVTPPLAGLDPLGVLTGSRLPLGACGLVVVTGREGPLSVSGSAPTLTIGATIGGGPEATLTADEVLDHLLGVRLLTGVELAAADVDRSGDIDAADLVRVVLHGGTYVSGGDPRALVAVMPDGDGPLDERSVLSALGTRTVSDDGAPVGTFDVVHEESLASLAPSRLTIFPGETVNIALQIDNDIGTMPVTAYTAKILYSAAAFDLVGSVTGAADNGDFEGTPSVTTGSGFVTVSQSLTSRSPGGERVINVANATFRLRSGVQAGQLLGFALDGAATSLTPLGGSPVAPPAIKLLGCAVHVGP